MDKEDLYNQRSFKVHTQDSPIQYPTKCESYELRVMVLNNGQKGVHAGHYDVTVKLTKCHHFIIFIPIDICLKFCHS